MSKPPAPSVPLEPYFRIDEVAEALRTSRSTVVRHVHAGRLQAVRFGRDLRIPKSALDEFLVPAERSS